MFSDPHEVTTTERYLPLTITELKAAHRKHHPRYTNQTISEFDPGELAESPRFYPRTIRRCGVGVGDVKTLRTDVYETIDQQSDDRRYT